jgi:hypothetical protein
MQHNEQRHQKDNLAFPGEKPRIYTVDQKEKYQEGEAYHCRNGEALRSHDCACRKEHESLGHQRRKQGEQQGKGLHIYQFKISIHVPDRSENGKAPYKPEDRRGDLIIFTKEISDLIPDSDQLFHCFGSFSFLASCTSAFARILSSSWSSSPIAELTLTG